MPLDMIEWSGKREYAYNRPRESTTGWKSLGLRLGYC